MLDTLSRLRIQETCTLLENIHISDGLYHPKYQYASLTTTNLSLKNTQQFLTDIKNQFATLTQLKFKLFEVNLNHLLKNKPRTKSDLRRNSFNAYHELSTQCRCSYVRFRDLFKQVRYLCGQTKNDN